MSYYTNSQKYSYKEYWTSSLPAPDFFNWSRPNQSVSSWSGSRLLQPIQPMLSLLTQHSPSGWTQSRFLVSASGMKSNSSPTSILSFFTRHEVKLFILQFGMSRCYEPNSLKNCRNLSRTRGLVRISTVYRSIRTYTSSTSVTRWDK